MIKGTGGENWGGECDRSSTGFEWSMDFGLVKRKRWPHTRADLSERYGDY